MVSDEEDITPFPRSEMRRGVALLPNLLTTANLSCGFFAIIHALKGKFILAVWFILVATLLDFLDGRVARMTGTESRFGREYDSLADLCTFAIAPAFIIYTWGLIHLSKFGTAACFLYFLCGALRLARFNVQATNIEKTDFQGLPTPAAGGTLVAFVLFFEVLFGRPVLLNTSVLQPFLYFLAGFTIVLGLLMVSNVRYRSLKRVKRKTGFVSLIIIVLAIFVVASQPEFAIFFFGMGYILHGLVRWIVESPKRRRSFREFFLSLYGERSAQQKKYRHQKEFSGSEDKEQNVLNFYDKRDGS